MAINKNALIRYRTIDKCLQNRHRRWTLDDLITTCSDALYEFEGRDINVSKRTIQMDIQFMRSDKLGYNAPIVVYEKKYYTYDDENYSITETPLTELDMNILSESVAMLSQFKNFSLFAELNGVIQKLEDKIYTENNDQSAIIHIEKNENLKGLDYLDVLYQAILKRIVLKLTYRSFKARTESEMIFHGYILKEFNNRWFLVGRKADNKKIMTLALDRILKVDYELSVEYSNTDFDPDRYYAHTYGVTVLGSKQLINVELHVDHENAPYVTTKPIHSSQQVLNQFDDGGVRIGLRLHHNRELERLILGFGASMEVIKPASLRKIIKSKLRRAHQQYLIHDE